MGLNTTQKADSQTEKGNFADFLIEWMETYGQTNLNAKQIKRLWDEQWAILISGEHNSCR